MEWLGNGEESSTTRGSTNVQQESLSTEPGDSHSAMTSLCQNQQCCLKASILSGWRLAEAQDQLCSLEVHSSESVEQERARSRACPTELSHTEQEWQRKESMLGGPELSCSPVLADSASWDVFNRSIINNPVSSHPITQKQEDSKTFIQKYEQDLKHFGLLHRWDDSQRFLSDRTCIVCEEAANFLILWCVTLQQEGKEALMSQVAHQAVVMQFILEMASNSKQDPRGCFRQFFHKAKEGSSIYQEVFHSELEAFKLRIKEYVFKCRENSTNCVEHQRIEDILPSVAEHSIKHGLWTNALRLAKDDNTETEDYFMMETS